MAPKVYGILASPPYAAVLICAKTLGIDVETVEVNLLNGEHLKEDFVNINPQHTIPLLDDHGFILADSHAINGYLVGTYGKENDHLYPRDDIKRRAVIDHRLYLDATIVAARGFLVTRSLGLENKMPTQEAIIALRDAFSILDKQIQLQYTKYIAGNALSIADFSITTTVTHWGFFLKGWEGEFPSLKSYIERMMLEKWFEICQKSKNEFNEIIERLLNSHEK